MTECHGTHGHHGIQQLCVMFYRRGFMPVEGVDAATSAVTVLRLIISITKNPKPPPPPLPEES